jgi:glycosyltransferase involved in cell wall biosynthesis
MPPLVSCIMPTRNRRQFAGQAIAYFLRQDYPRKELIIIDDGEESLADLVPDHADIRYVRYAKGLSLGAKRNMACEMSRGDLIAHWDDDDWMAPHRLSTQVNHLLRSGAAVSGLDRLFYYEPSAGRAWFYQSSVENHTGLAGGTLLYRRDTWQAHRFPELNVAEDAGFLYQLEAGAIQALDAADLYVGLIHPGNTAAKSLDGACWQARPIAEVARLLAPDRGFYVALRNGRTAVVGDGLQNNCRITLAAPFMVYDGYGSVAEQLALGLQGDGAAVNVVPLELNPEGTTAAFQQLLREAVSDPGDTVLYFCWPRADLQRFLSVPNLFIYTMWEASRLPRGWAACLNRARAVIVPTRFVRSVCRESGVTVPVEVVPQGVDPALYHYLRRPRRPGVTTLMVGTVIGRKHIHEGIAAWKEAFGDDPRARLIIKARFQYNTYHPDDSRIGLVDANETTRGIAHWYARADVLLALGNEGFGLPLVEGMATGLPVIALNTEGQSDVCADAPGCLLPVPPDRWEPCDDPPFGPAGVRAVPSVAVIADHLRWVAAHPAEARAMGRAASKWVLKHRNIRTMGPAVLDVLECHVRPLRRRETFCVPSWRTACGVAEYCGHLAAHLEKAVVTDRVADMRGVRLLHIQHEHSLWNNADLLQTVYAAKGYNIPVVVTEHAVDLLPHPWEEQADALVAHTRVGVERLQRRWPNQRVVHIPHGCPTWFPPRKPFRGRTIGFFGFLERHKGCWHLLEVLRCLPDTELLMFSHAKDADLEACWERDARGLAVRRCRDFLPAEQIARRLAAEADILVYWYDDIAMAAASGAVRIALASGVPVLTSPVGWFEDVQKVTYQPDDLKEGVQRLLQDTVLRENLTAGAKAFCNQHSWARTASRHRQLWQELQ